MKKIVFLLFISTICAACANDHFELDPDEQFRSYVFVIDRVEFDPGPIDAYIHYSKSQGMIDHAAEPSAIMLFRNGVFMLNASNNLTESWFRDPFPVPGQTYRYVIIARYNNTLDSDSSNAFTFTVPL